MKGWKVRCGKVRFNNGKPRAKSRLSRRNEGKYETMRRNKVRSSRSY